MYRDVDGRSSLYGWELLGEPVEVRRLPTGRNCGDTSDSDPFFASARSLSSLERRFCCCLIIRKGHAFFTHIEIFGSNLDVIELDLDGISAERPRMFAWN
jgi:hypothetical protein